MKLLAYELGKISAEAADKIAEERAKAVKEDELQAKIEVDDVYTRLVEEATLQAKKGRFAARIKLTSTFYSSSKCHTYLKDKLDSDGFETKYSALEDGNFYANITWTALEKK